MTDGSVEGRSPIPSVVRVAIVALYPLDSAHMIGGMRVAVYNLVQALSALNDLDIHVVYCHNDVAADHTVQQGQVTNHFLALPRRRMVPNYVRSLFRIYRCLREIKPNVVNGHTSHFAIPGLLARLPTVLTLHGVAHREAAIYNRTLFDWLRFRFALLYDCIALSRVKYIIAISPYIESEYARRTRARWISIPNPLPEDYFTLARSEEAGRIFYAGTITPLKDIMTLLRAMVIVRQTVPEVRLRLAGRTGDAAYEQELRNFVAANNLAGNVEFLGLLDTPGMLREYAACSLVVLPSRQEVLPMTIIESMASGIPVVATRVGGVTALVEDGVTGCLVNAGDRDGMARAISQLLSDGELRQSMGEHARSFAQDRFRAAAVAATYRRVYWCVAASARGDVPEWTECRVDQARAREQTRR
jgi:glycosyltransferase involved in cell wall biosynthesis